MESISYIIGIGLTILFFIGFFSSIGVGIYSVYITPLVPEIKLIKGLNQRQKEILRRHIVYYQDLSPPLKRDFERRVRYFLSSKEFIPKKMEQVTEEMKILISASAIQLAFGFRPINFASFPKIIIFPEEYYSSFSKRMHKGEVNLKGSIVFSWQDFLKGYKFPFDGYNVGLHEMAHVLQMEDAFGKEEFTILDAECLSNWHKVSLLEYRKIRKGEKSFLREYAGTSLPEFFAVCVEHFFEQPQQFKQQIPLLYEALVRLLHQDPTNGNSPRLPRKYLNKI